jgi:hypothetical protein
VRCNGNFFGKDHACLVGTYVQKDALLVKITLRQSRFKFCIKPISVAFRHALVRGKILVLYCAKRCSPRLVAFQNYYTNLYVNVHFLFGQLFLSLSQCQ